MVKVAAIIVCAALGLIGLAVVLFIAGGWFDWPIAEWIWNQLP